MPRLHFIKMHGAGNDYIYFDCFRQPVDDPQTLAIRLSDRRKAVGGDGVILICPSETADGRMRMFNADGSEGKMCGNGIRCVAKYLYDSGLARKEELHIETLSGVKTCWIHPENGVAVSVTVDMGRAVLTPAQIPVDLPGEQVVGRRVSRPAASTRSPASPWAIPTASCSGPTPIRWTWSASVPGLKTTPCSPTG